MSGVPITNQRCFYVNSFYCQYTNTNFITYTLDCEQSYLDYVNRVAITKIFIPGSKFYQFDPSDVFILEEDGVQVSIALPYANYPDYIDMTNDLQSMLNNNSPHSYTYTVTLNPNQLSMTITVNNNTTVKKILIPDDVHLITGYGLNNENIFVNNNTLTSTILSKTPTDELFVNSNCVIGFNSGDLSSSILTAFDLKQNTMQQTDLLTAAKVYNNVKRITFTLSDFAGFLVDLNGKHWWFELQLFYYDEAYIEKQRLFIDYVTIDIMEKNRQKLEKEREKQKVILDELANIEL